MSNPRYSPEFKAEAICQVIERGYSVREVAERIGVITDRESKAQTLDVARA